ncbi:CHAP domain-containing protein [Komagataeibacter rhaeticus]|nr:CHAP domain-containing protein [Komagataeibacter rhaeticus]
MVATGGGRRAAVACGLCGWQRAGLAWRAAVRALCTAGHAYADAGDAASWWGQAQGRYPRAHAPKPGAVLVFRATGRPPDGHVSVVRAVRGPREVLVDQANWVPGRIGRAEPVVDVSGRNDWSRVRVWWSPFTIWAKPSILLTDSSCPRADGVGGSACISCPRASHRRGREGRRHVVWQADNTVLARHGRAWGCDG